MVWYEDESCKSLTLTLKTSNTLVCLFIFLGLFHTKTVVVPSK